MSADAAAQTPTPADEQQPLVEADHVELHFPIKQGVLIDRTIGVVHAVDDVSLRLEEGQTTTLSVLETQRDLRRALLRELSAQLEYQRVVCTLRHSLSGLTITVVSTMLSGAGSVAESDLPIFP